MARDRARLRAGATVRAAARCRAGAMVRARPARVRVRVRASAAHAQGEIRVNGIMARARSWSFSLRTGIVIKARACLGRGSVRPIGGGAGLGSQCWHVARVCFRAMVAAEASLWTCRRWRDADMVEMQTC